MFARIHTSETHFKKWSIQEHGLQQHLFESQSNWLEWRFRVRQQFHGGCRRQLCFRVLYIAFCLLLYFVCCSLCVIGCSLFAVFCMLCVVRCMSMYLFVWCCKFKLFLMLSPFWFSLLLCGSGGGGSGCGGCGDFGGGRGGYVVIVALVAVKTLPLNIPKPKCSKPHWNTLVEGLETLKGPSRVWPKPI